MITPHSAMHICVVSGTFHPEPGGPPTFLYRLLPELQARGHHVRVVAYGEPDAPTSASSVEPTDYPYRVIRISRRRSIPHRLLAFTWAVMQAGRSADVFLVSDYGLPVAIANLWLRRPILLKYVGDFAWEFCTRHRWIPEGQTIDEFQVGPHSPRVNLLRAVQRWYVSSAARVIAPSRYSAKLVTSWGVDPNRVQVIYNALEAPGHEPDRAAARKDLNVSYPMLVTIARLTPWKGIDGIIRAFSLVRQGAPNARLVVVGDGPERQRLEAQAEALGDAVAFVGAQPPEKVQGYLRAADVFVLFSTYEGLPHTVLEAMQAGTPVVVSDAGGNTEVVTDGVNGWVVRAGDERGLAQALIEVLSSPQEARRRTEAAAASLERFSWARLVDEYDAALRALA